MNADGVSECRVFMNQGSEVARLLAEIRAEYEAAQNGLQGFAIGTAQHEFITARMNNIGQKHTQLRGIVGDQAMPLIAETLEQLQ
jgi:hypothetical protein